MEQIAASKIQLTFINLKSKLTIDIPLQTDERQTQLIKEFLLIFGEESLSDDGEMQIGLRIKNVYDEKLKEDIGKLISKQIRENNSLKGLGYWIGRMNINEIFRVYPGQLNKEEEKIVEYELMKDNDPNFSDEKYAEVQALKQSIEHSYKINVFNQDNFPIGEIDKEKRVCLFCGKTKATGATFRDVAHAISESFGNKKLIQHEECDECNNKFGRGIECDFANHFLPFRIHMGVKGKNGVPEIGNNKYVEMKNENGVISIKRYLKEGEEVGPDNVIKIPMPHKFTPSSIYRTLAKYFVSLYGNNKRDELKDLVKWINGSPNGSLPKVARLLEYGLYTEHPFCIIYERTNNDQSIPKYIIEFRFLMFAFVAIIPFIENSETKFCDEVNYEQFWSKMSHYNTSNLWKFEDYYNEKTYEVVWNYQMNQKEANEKAT